MNFLVCRFCRDHRISPAAWTRTRTRGPLPHYFPLMSCVGGNPKQRTELKEVFKIYSTVFTRSHNSTHIGSRVEVVHKNMWCCITALRPDLTIRIRLDKAVSHTPCPHRVFIMPETHSMGASILISKQIGNPSSRPHLM